MRHIIRTKTCQWSSSFPLGDRGSLGPTFSSVMTDLIHPPTLTDFDYPGESRHFSGGMTSEKPDSHPAWFEPRPSGLPGLRPNHSRSKLLPMSKWSSSCAINPIQLRKTIEKKHIHKKNMASLTQLPSSPSPPVTPCRAPPAAGLRTVSPRRCCPAALLPPLARTAGCSFHPARVTPASQLSTRS